MNIGNCIEVSMNLTAISKIGSKDKDVVTRLAKMITWCKKKLDEFYPARDALVAGYSKRDSNGEVVVKTEGGRQEPVIENEVEFNLKMNELTRKDVDTSKLPKPFSLEELLKDGALKELPPPAVLAGLGPFITGLED